LKGGSIVDDGDCLRLVETSLEIEPIRRSVDGDADLALHVPRAHPARPPTADLSSNCPSEPESTVRLKALVSAQRRLASFDGSIDELAALVPGFALDAIEATGAVFELFEGDALVAKAASPALAGLHRHALPARRQPLRRSLQDQPDLTSPDARVDLASRPRSSIDSSSARSSSRSCMAIRACDRRADDREARALRFPTRRRLPSRTARRRDRRGHSPQAIER
jgi:hypothetical protein